MQVDLYLGDCLEVMPKLQSETVDLTVTSPPYDNLRKYDGSINWGEHIWKPIIQELYRITKVGGVVVWVVGDATVNGSETGTSFRQALFAKDCDFNLHDTMIYHRPGTGAKGSNYCYWQAFEYMFLFSKGKPRSVNRIRDKVNSRVNSIVNCNKQKRESVKTRLHKKTGTIVGEFGIRENIWKFYNGFGHTEYTGHPAPFPEALAGDHIISWSKEGDIVFDPMMGSGTTGKMALLNNRRFIGIEKVKEYFFIAKQRIEDARRQGNLFTQAMECANAG